MYQLLLFQTLFIEIIIGFGLRFVFTKLLYFSINLDCCCFAKLLRIYSDQCQIGIICGILSKSTHKLAMFLNV
jgi:hypothetical protein